MNQSTPEARTKLKKKRNKHLKIISAAIILCYDQVGDRGHVHWEWPRGARCHDLQWVRQMVSDLSLKAAALDGCQVGACDDNTGKLFLKPRTTYTASETMLRAMSLCCTLSRW